MGIFNWQFSTRALEASDEGIVIPTRDASPRDVTVADAVSLSSVYRAISIIGTAVKQLSIDAYRNDEIVDPAPSLVRNPNLDDPRSIFYEQTAISLAASGNAYWLIDRDSSDRAINLTILNPHEVEPQTNAEGRLTGYRWAHRQKTISARDIKHLKLLRIPGRTKGLGPIQAASAELRGALDVRDYASNWFHDSGQPAGGYWTTKGTLAPQAAKAYRESLTQATRDRAGVPVVGDGLRLEPFALSPEDAQWLESQRFSTTTIARLFAVPSSLMLASLDGDAQSYQNVSQELQGWISFGLAQYTTEIEEALSSLLPRGQRARFNFESLLRLDTTSRYQAHATAISAGFLTVDEVRAIENLPPLPKEPKPEPVAPAPEPSEAPETESEASDE